VSDLLVTLTVDQLRQIVREELKAVGQGRTVAPLPPVLTSEQASEYLQIPVGVLRKRTAKGEVPSFKIGAVLRYRRAELDEWIAAGGKKAG
jgi:excisionase family DNA binding protein